MNFSVSCQYAHQDHSESTGLGVKFAVDVLRAFDDFDWFHQAAEAIRLEKVSPTFSVEDIDKKRLIWVSVYDDLGSLKFVSECTFPGLKRYLFGLFEREGVIGLHTQEFKLEEARKAIELFMENKEVELRTLYESRQ